MCQRWQYLNSLSFKMSLPPPAVIYLRSLEAVRDRSQQVFDLAVGGKLDHWDWHEGKLKDVVDYCANMIEVNIASVIGTSLSDDGE